MPRQKKPTYEYVPKLGRYRKRIKDIDGKYVAIYGKTIPELEANLDAARREIESGLIRRENPTVGEYIEQWIELNTPAMKYKYRESVIGALRNHVTPVIGHLYLADVRPDDVQLVMAKLGGSSSSLNSKVLQNMRKVFRSAQRNGRIQRDPCEDLRAGGKKQKRVKALTPQQVITLLEAVAGTPVEPFVRLALFAGLRREEALGLKWSSVDLDGAVPTLTVERAVSWEKNRPVVDEDLKSTAAFRRIPIPAQLSDCLLGWKAMRIAEKPKDMGYVFGGDSPITSSQWRNLWRYVTARQTGETSYRKSRAAKPEKVTFMRELGTKSRGGNFCYTIDFPVTPHQLRHTYCTNLILSGANIKRVQYLMGHADIKVTLDIYTQLIDNSPEALADEITSAFGVKEEVKNIAEH